MSCVERANEIRKKLISKGHVVFASPYIDKSPKDVEELLSDKTYLESKKPFFIKEHFKKISDSDAILVVNLDNKGIKNYVGGNTFAEIMVAFFLGKKIYFLNPIPTDERLSIVLDEIKAVKPILLDGDLDAIS